MRRRRLVGAAVAGSAAAAGAAWQFRQSAGVASADPAQQLWTRRFEQPDGGRLAMSALRGRPLLLNLWATWCPPCVRELPLLDAFHRRQRDRGWQVVGLALDAAAPVQRFLQTVPVAFPIAIAGADGLQLARGLGNAGGQLPFTAVFARDGSLHTHKLGVVESVDLERWAAELS